MQKGIRAEDGENKSEQDAGDDGGDFHGVMMNWIGDISITILPLHQYALDAAVMNEPHERDEHMPDGSIVKKTA